MKGERRDEVERIAADFPSFGVQSTHKTGEMLAVQQFFESLGTQGRDAFSFTKDYGVSLRAFFCHVESKESASNPPKLTGFLSFFFGFGLGYTGTEGGSLASMGGRSR